MVLRGTVWKPIGPSPIAVGTTRLDNGMVTSIAVHPTNPSIVYLGTGGGGLWRTVNNGTRWRSLFDRQISLNVGESSAIAIDPVDPDTLYVGISGAAFARPGAFALSAIDTTAGRGLYKSTDAGASWIRLGSGFPVENTGTANNFANDWIYSIVVEPTDQRIVYLAARSGVYRSTDAGLNFRRGIGAAGNAESLAVDLSSPVGNRVLYAGINGTGVITSTDGGVNWTPLPNAAAALGAGFGKVVVALAPPASPPNAAGVQVIYLCAENTATDNLVGFFVSPDAGTTWTPQTATDLNLAGATQNGFSFTFAVDPASPGNGTSDTIYLGCVRQLKSTDSGDSFTSVCGPVPPPPPPPFELLHADTHVWAFGPPGTSPPPPHTPVYVGTDGGCYQSDDGGTTWTAHDHNSGTLQATLFYNIDSKPDAAASVVVGALQDNGLQSTAGQVPPRWRARGGDGWNAVFDGGAGSNIVYGADGVYTAIPPNPPVPATQVRRSNDDGASYTVDITPWGTTSDQGAYIAAIATRPGTADTVYVSGNQNLWQSVNGGNNWRRVNSVGGPGDIAVSPINGDYVVHAVGPRVFLSTNALATPVGDVQFLDITRNLLNTGRNVQRVAFDPIDPTVVYAVLGGFDGAPPAQQGHVFRTTVSATRWTNISPPVDIPMGAIALDATTTPTTIYVGTDLGVVRTVDLGRSWSVLDDIHLPKVPVTDLDFSEQAGVLRAATFGRGVFEFVVPQDPAISIDPENNLDFGEVCAGESRHLTLSVFNVGGADLVITSVQWLMGSTSFTVLPYPSTPVHVEPGEHITFSVRYTPTSTGAVDEATIRIISNDPDAPIVDLDADGRAGAPAIDLIVPDAGEFGAVCLGSFVDLDVIVANSGSCALTITGITSSSGEFLVPGVLSYPLTIAPGTNLEAPIRFQPSSIGSKASTITVHSNDPAGPKTVVVSGTAPAPRLTLVVPDDGDFGQVRLGRFTDRDLAISNGGPCPLSVTGIVSSAPIFVTPQVVSFPLTVEGGDSITVPIRFEPTHRGAATATLTIVSNDPTGPVVVNVSGTAWPPLPVAGSALEGYPLSNDSQHVFFIGTDKFAHELDITAGEVWDDNDLTTLAGAVPPIPTSALAGFRLSNNSKHVFFIGTDKHVYELYFTAGEGWVFNDLTALAGAVAPTPSSALEGFRLGDDSKHVFFIGTDNHVHELFIAAGGRWDDNDLTTLAGAVPPAATSALVGFRLGDNSKHVFFIGTDNHVHELFTASAGWADNDLTTLAGAVAPTPGSALTGYPLSDNSQHVFFIGTDNQVHELFIAGAGWADNNLTTLAGAVAPTPGSALVGYPLSDNSQHVFFIGTDSHVHELFIAGAGWADSDLTTLAGAVPPTPTSALAGYRLSNNSKHVFFIGTDNHVHELFIAAGAGWLDNDLTALT
jgi:hypothetical protein